MVLGRGVGERGGEKGACASAAGADPFEAVLKTTGMVRWSISPAPFDVVMANSSLGINPSEGKGDDRGLGVDRKVAVLIFRFDRTSASFYSFDLGFGLVVLIVYAPPSGIPMGIGDKSAVGLAAMSV